MRREYAARYSGGEDKQVNRFSSVYYLVKCPDHQRQQAHDKHFPFLTWIYECQERRTRCEGNARKYRCDTTEAHASDTEISEVSSKECGEKIAPTHVSVERGENVYWVKRKIFGLSPAGHGRAAEVPCPVLGDKVSHLLRCGLFAQIEFHPDIETFHHLIREDESSEVDYCKDKKKQRHQPLSGFQKRFER